VVLRVAVTDPLPLFRRGVMAVIAEAGFDAETPEDVLGFARIDEPRIILFTVLAPDDWTLLAQVCQARQETVVVAVLDHADPTEYLRALTAGAAGVLPRQATPELVRATFDAAVRGESLLPIPVVHALAHHATSADSRTDPAQPNADERAWLQALARGTSVATLAGQAGYSERMMFRLLRELYNRIGAANRTAALIRARDEHWI
jgi:DNA-binding NarL/FixJ family response regulator